MNMDLTLTMNGIEDGSTVYWCALVLKQAGTKTSYDCGMCEHEYIKSLDKNTNPSEEEFDEIKKRWDLSDKYFSADKTYEQGEPYRKDPSVLNQFAD